MRRAAVLVVMLFVLPLLTQTSSHSVDPRAQSTLGRSTDADVAVTDLNVTTPSVMISGVPTLAPQTHIIRVSILNLGGSSADGNLTLEANTGSGFAEVDERVISINPGQQEVHLLYWDATAGSGYGLRAVWDVNLSISTDSDASNDEITMSGINVISVEDALPIADSLPDNGDTMARAQWVGGITVVNAGNQPVNVTAQLALTSTSSGDQMQIQSTTAEVPAGSLANPPEPQNLSLSFDGTNLEGTYTLSGSLLVTGPSGTPSTVTIDSRTVSFIALRATLIAASNRNIDPGGETILNFILQNSGDEGDNFTVTQSNTSSPGEYWANVSSTIHSTSDPLFVDSGDTVAIQVPVEVPSDAAISESVRITVAVQSHAAGYVLDASSVVMAGGLYQSEITQNHSHPSGVSFANLTPGESKTLDYILTNTGTAPAQFQIFVAPTQAVPYWQIDSPVTLTDVLMANDTRTIPVTVTTPSLQMPLNPAWNIEAGLQIQIGIQAIPIEGGLPSTALTTLIIDGMVEMDLEIVGQPQDVTVEEFLGGSSDRYVDFQVQMVHNLGSNNSQAQVTLSPTVVGTDTTGITFEPCASNCREPDRYFASITPSTMDLSPGEIGYGVVSITHQHKNSAGFPYPASGQFTFAFTTTSDWGDFNGTISSDDSAEITYRVKKFSAAELTSGSVATGDPGSPIPATMSMKNTGNSEDNFTIGHVPVDGWTIQASKTAVNGMKSRTNLYPFEEGTDDSDVTSFTVTATPPSTASADTIHEVWVYVNSTDTGELLSYAPAYFQLTELISAELSPANATAILDRLGQSTIMILLNNSGNSNKTFDLVLDNHDRDSIQVSFADDLTEQLAKTQTVAAASQAIVRVYALAGTTARADAVNKFEVAVSSDGVELSRSGITVQVNPFHFIIFQMNKEYNAVPGGTLNVPINLINSGNLMEMVNITTLTPEDWNTSVNDSNIEIEPGLQGSSVELSITLPPLEPGSILAADEVYEVTVQVLNITDNILIGTTNITVTILPVFALNILSQPDRIAVLPSGPRTVPYQIENAGNAPVTITFDWDLQEDEPGRFSISLNAPTSTINLEIGESATLGVTVTPQKDDHFVGEDATLSIIFTALGIDLDPIELTTAIHVVRVHADDAYELNADGPFDCGASCVEIQIPWQHVPTGVPNPSAVAYNLSLASDPVRLVNYWSHPWTNWAFDIDGRCILVSSEEAPGIGSPDNQICTSGFDLDTVTPYGGGTITLQIVLPDKKNLAAGDGWDIELRLKNPNEPDTPEFWTDFTVQLRMTEASDPLIESIKFNGTDIEGSQTAVTVRVINAGNAMMPLGTDVTLFCQGNYARVTSPQTITIPPLAPSGNFSATWAVQTDPLPWWRTSSPFDCQAVLSGTISTIWGNNATNDNASAALVTSSWGPPSVVLDLGGFPITLPLVTVLGLLLLLAAFSFLRRGLDEKPNHLHMSAYLAAAAFGTLSLANFASWSIAAGAGASIVFAGIVAWISSAELQTIHDDRKKARIGTRAVLEDHDKEQANTRKELRAIISCAPYAFLPFVLITPALAIDTDALSLGTLLLFLLVSPMLVHSILRFLDKSYDKLYGELAEIELRAIKIKKILGSVGSKTEAGAQEHESRTGGN